MLNTSELKELMNDGGFDFFKEIGNYVNIDEYVTIYNWNSSIDVEYFDLNKLIDITKEITHAEIIEKITTENKSVYTVILDVIKEVIDEVNK